MLVEMAIGDAYAAAFEFMDDAFIARENDLSGYKRNPETGLGGGCYTDDTQMTVAVTEHLLSGETMSPHALADRFVTAFKRDERRGYSKRLFHTLQGVAMAGAFWQPSHQYPTAAAPPCVSRRSACCRTCARSWNWRPFRRRSPMIPPAAG